MAETRVPTTVSARNTLTTTATAPAPAPVTPADVSLLASVPLPTDRSSDFIQNLVRAANGSAGLQDRPFNTNTSNASIASHPATADNRRTSPVSSLASSSSSSNSTSLASIRKENHPLPPLPSDAHDLAPRRSLQDIGYQYTHSSVNIDTHSCARLFVMWAVVCRLTFRGVHLSVSDTKIAIETIYASLSFPFFFFNPFRRNPYLHSPRVHPVHILPTTRLQSQPWTNLVCRPPLLQYRPPSS